VRTTVAVVDGPGRDFLFEEVEVDGPQADEVLVRIVATGLCHTDISLRDTLPAEMFPRVFGHEGAGVVEEVGPEVTGIAAGDHVVLSLASCRSCGNCRQGLAGYFEQTLMLNYLGFRTDGSTSYSREAGPVFGHFFGQSSFSRHAVVSANSVVVVDKELDLAMIAPYGCGFMAGSGSVLNVLKPGPDDSGRVRRGRGRPGRGRRGAGERRGHDRRGRPGGRPARGRRGVRRGRGRPGRARRRRASWTRSRS
jgi:aryl-alcohol dehydrogenase